ncbi:murein L,D-transpeptidase catalytic domain family protein [Sphingosinicella sp. BN140058]|uniref:murein L,D-transpeptidase catalytic domain family protein n=1 Tax=Sphingosinicella sp. BN140058 TaxID=1892855 RepID=UPI0013EADDB3|nr:murein L,D-transpeptidase catalytic domain family protein [Sphingosinicella sp. BN140058]
MNYSRRQLLGAGAAAGLIATTAQAESLAKIVAGLNDGARAPMPRAAAAAVPARPRVLVDPVIDPRLLARARAAFDANRNRIRRTDLVAITDFSRASREPRFFILDTNTGKVSSHYVAHGRGSDPDHSGYLEHFSNAFGSNATSAGAYITGDYYNGKYGRSMKVKGLERRNDNAEGRAIVVHSAWYAEPEVIREHGKLGRSEGCFALSHASLQEVLRRLGPGHFLYADKLA